MEYPQWKTKGYHLPNIRALYSAANIIKRGASPLENEFIFIQNPYAPPVFKIFAPLIRPGNAYGYKVSEKQEPGHGG